MTSKTAPRDKASFLGMDNGAEGWAFWKQRRDRGSI